jgi:hypothetical protein
MNYYNKYIEYKEKYIINGGNIDEAFFNISFYHYLLKNYNIGKNLEIKTMSFKKINLDQCGIVEIKNENENETKRSCDYFYSELKNNNFNKKFDTDFNMHFTLKTNFEKKDIQISSYDMLKFTFKYGAKSKNRIKIKPEQVGTLGVLYDIDNILNILKNVKQILIREWGSTKIYKNNTLIKYIKHIDNIQYIIFGDFHGSYATFMRHLFRFRSMNIINSLGQINNGYKIIFLGDILDRGKYDYELIMIIYMLIINNPNNIIFNRGNHEEQNIWSRDGFLNTLKIQFGNISSIINKNINEIVQLQSSAIILHHPIKQKKIYMAHGGLPVNVNVNVNNKYELNLLPEFIYKLNENKNIIINDNDINSSVQSNNIQTNTIRWSDFTGMSNSLLSFNRSVIIGIDIINILLNTSISFIIRGHTDSISNAFLYKNIQDKKENVSENVNLVDALIYNTTIYDKIIINEETTQNLNVKCIGPIAILKQNMDNSLFLNNIKLENGLPILTISTNTDTERKLYEDSFIILNFNIKQEELNCTSI